MGAIIIPDLVRKVGHIRVFAAFASMASLAILIHAIFVDPIVWIFGRFLTGFSIIGIFIVVESWLNDRANNRTRGQVLSAYMFVSLMGLAIGTLLLNFSSPEKYEPFILIYPNFLNLGALRFVSRMGIKDKDNNKEININGSNFSGLLKFNKRVPHDNPIKVINI